ncbi:MAG TPA: DPP IV N-terminal domain-containing protein [Verrucomicrobiales bacterium]|nr:DPP IV N-terminal domain-containing protein [Verrucomicrobiales bacterium]
MRLPLLLLTILLAALQPVAAQSRLPSMPGYDRYKKLKSEIPKSWKSGALSVQWKDGGKSFEYDRDGKRWRYDIEKKQATDEGPERQTPPQTSEQRADQTRQDREWKQRPERGRQFPSVPSPSGDFVAFHRDRNLYLDGSGLRPAHIAVTTDATNENRLRYGTASWVYGEELDQKSAIWWAPNGRKLAFYKFDESRVPDYFLALDQTKRQSTLDIEPFAMPGSPNPQVDLLIYDLESKQIQTVDVRSGKPFDDDHPGHYVFSIMWSPDGKELLFHRMDRRQKVLDLCAADPASGKVRVILHEEWPASWVDYDTATLRFLNDGRRFIRESERTGWKNYYLYDLSGQLLATLTKHEFEVAGIVRVDESANKFYYLARSGSNPMKVQLHRCALDGSGDVRLTDPAFHHSVNLAPDGKHFIDVAQTHSSPPATWLVNDSGTRVAELASSDLKKWDELKLKKVERFTFKAADEKTDLYGLLHFPSNFDPAKKWPLIVSVYAGPATNGARETFSTPSTTTELGYLVASFDSRSAAGRGKKFLDAIYQKLGQAEIDDQAAGVKALVARGYVDGARVGIHGVSYGGTASAMCLMRHSSVFQAACASSGVMDFRNYDSIYTERYLGLPKDSAAAYDAANPQRFVKDLKGRLMIFYGTADNNVHPSNSLQLIKALQDENKSFDLQIGPDAGHAGINNDRLMEFFQDSLGSGPK